MIFADILFPTDAEKEPRENWSDNCALPDGVGAGKEKNKFWKRVSTTELKTSI